jgi:hypothetical protein|tara:strand:+ start:254 stop:463 length:210 start_codon:yes stop_codon:yes gene_type:complete
MELKKYVIITYAQATFKYYVDAKSTKDAESKYLRGWADIHNDGMPTDVHDEQIDEIYCDTSTHKKVRSK